MYKVFLLLHVTCYIFKFTSMSSQNQGSSSSQGSADYLRSATFSTGSGTIGGDNNAVTASELLTGGFDPARLHPMAGLKDQLEYLQLDDDKVNDLPGATTALPSRGWSDDLCYGTGTTYLSGMSSFFPFYYSSVWLSLSRLRKQLSYCSL